jgi:hypothetical protein
MVVNAITIDAYRRTFRKDKMTELLKTIRDGSRQANSAA